MRETISEYLLRHLQLLAGNEWLARRLLALPPLHSVTEGGGVAGH